MSDMYGIDALSRAFSAPIELAPFLGRCPRLLHSAPLALQNLPAGYLGRAPRLLHSAPSALRNLPAGYLGRCPRLLHSAPLVLMKKHRLSCARHSVKNL